MFSPKIAADSVQELRRKITEDALPRLDGKPVDFTDPNFRMWSTIYALVTWELSVRIELAKNPVGYNIDSSLVVYFYRMSKV